MTRLAQRSGSVIRQLADPLMSSSARSTALVIHPKHLHLGFERRHPLSGQHSLRLERCDLVAPEKASPQLCLEQRDAGLCRTGVRVWGLGAGWNAFARENEIACSGQERLRLGSTAARRPVRRDTPGARNRRRRAPGRTTVRCAGPAPRRAARAQSRARHGPPSARRGSCTASIPARTRSRSPCRG